MMVALKLLSIIIFAAVLTGCPDYQERAFLRKVLNKQQYCPPPGIPTNIICHYKLTVTDIKEKTARGQIPPEAVEPNQKGCEKLKEDGVYAPDYPCPNAKDHPANTYQFQIDDPSTVQTSKTYHFVNVPGTKSLMVAKE